MQHHLKNQINLVEVFAGNYIPKNPVDLQWIVYYLDSIEIKQLPIYSTSLGEFRIITSEQVLELCNSIPKEDDMKAAEEIFSTVGEVVRVDEKLVGAVTAVSGSGPAYYFLLMEAMETAALELGLNETQARLLIQQTALGAAKIALESNESPARLRQRVTSPGGTTQAALECFEQGGFSQLVNKALHAARDRSVALSTELGAL